MPTFSTRPLLPHQRASMKTLFTDCTILTEAKAPLIEQGYLVTNGQIIEEIGQMDAKTLTAHRSQADRIINASGKLLMPGLVNGHNHCAMTLFRGLADDLELSEWLHKHIFPAETAYAKPEMVYWCTRLAAAEMILSGTTTVADAYFYSNESARALHDCGMRAVIGHGIVDFSVPSVPDPKENVATVGRFIDQWHSVSPLIQPAVFAHAPYTCSPATLTKAKQLADDRRVRFFTHLAESRNEMAMILEPQGDTPVQHLANLNLLDDNTVLVHTVWLTADDISLLAKRGAQAITCPQSNMKLASGIAPVPEFLQFGISFGLGTDGCASNNGLDMFREMRSLAMIHKAAGHDATKMPAGSVLHAATAGGAAVLGLEKVGKLAAGWQADLILVDLQTANLTPFYNADLLVYAAGGGNVDSVMIAGRLVAEQKKILSFDLLETQEKVLHFAADIVRNS